MNVLPDQTDEAIVVLLCEDEPIIMMATTALLEDFGMTVIEATTLGEAQAALDINRVSIIVTDVHLPDGSGLVFASNVRKFLPSLPVIFATGDRNVPGFEALTNAAVIGKPYVDEELIDLIKKMTAE